MAVLGVVTEKGLSHFPFILSGPYTESHCLLLFAGTLTSLITWGTAVTVPENDQPLLSPLLTNQTKNKDVTIQGSGKSQKPWPGRTTVTTEWLSEQGLAG